MGVGVDALEVHWRDGATSEYPWLWVRDHSHDDATIHPQTHQRQLFTAGVDRELRGVRAELVDGHVEVGWNDPSVPPAVLPVPFLRRHHDPAPARIAVPAERTLWDGESIVEQWPTVGYDAVMASDDGVAEWLDLVARFGFGVATGTPPTVEATEALVRRIGYVRETIFGGFWDFQADLSKADTAYTNLELLPHTDGTYAHDAPGLQLLHCLAFDGEGGQSTMVDGFRIAVRAAHRRSRRLRGAVDGRGTRPVHRRRGASHGGTAGVPPRPLGRARAGVVQQR